MTILTRAKGVASENLFPEFYFFSGGEREKEGDRGAWRVGTNGSTGLVPRKEGRTLMELGSGYSCKFPPSQNPAYILLVGAFPAEGHQKTISIRRQDRQKQ